MRSQQYVLNTPEQKNSAFPLLLSMIAHGVIFGLLFFMPKPKLPTPSGIDANLISAGELAEIQGQIRENARRAEQGSSLGLQTRDSSHQNQPNQSTPSAAMQSYNAELAARQEAYRRQIASFAAEQDALALESMRAVEDAFAAQARERERELKQLRQSAAEQSQREAQNRQALEEAHQANQRRNEKREQALRESGGQSGSLSAGISASSETVSGTNTNQTTNTRQGGGGGNPNNIKAALERHIYAHWQVPNNASGERLSANIRTDASGNVISVSISGGTPALRASLENAIRNASPLTPVIGTDFRSFHAQFTAN